MSGDRCLNWDGCTNVRDLGGLPADSGRTTRWGMVVRGDHPSHLSAAGWSALYEYGIRTIITLATDGHPESFADVSPRPADLVTVRCAIEDFGDAEFVERWVLNDLISTPLYYLDALQRWPQRHAAVIQTIARAKPGGILIHCRAGKDRTGLISLLLLALAGVPREDILADYALSEDTERDALLARENTSTSSVIMSTLDQLDVQGYLRAGGVSDAELVSVRARLLEAPVTS